MLKNKIIINGQISTSGIANSQTAVPNTLIELMKTNVLVIDSMNCPKANKCKKQKGTNSK